MKVKEGIIFKPHAKTIIDMIGATQKKALILEEAATVALF